MQTNPATLILERVRAREFVRRAVQPINKRAADMFGISDLLHHTMGTPATPAASAAASGSSGSIPAGTLI
jgi:hypothetical protein